MSTLLHMHGPRSEKRHIIASPVWRRPVTFSLGHALLHNGLLPPLAEGARGLSLRLATRARRQWRCKVDAMLDDAEAAGVLDRPRLDRGDAPAGTLIGWRPTAGSAARGEFWICIDLTLTLLVLERRVGNLYVSSRPPDRSWRNLFERALTVDDPRFVGAPISAALPWMPERKPAEGAHSECVDISANLLAPPQL